jgi:signal transduction histidine kinase
VPDARRHVVRGVAGPAEGRILDVSDSLTVGRADACDASIADRRLSRRHFRLFVDADGLGLEDLDSQHGTHVNGVRVVRGRLKVGDHIEAGKSRFEVLPAEARRGARVTIVPDADRFRPKLVKPVAEAARPALDARNFEILYEITRSIQRARDADAMIADTIDRLLLAVRADRGYVALLDEAGALFPRSVRYRDPSLAPFGATRVALSSTVRDQVLTGRCGLISADAAKDDRFATTDTVLLSDITSLVAVPILLNDRVLGLMELEAFDPEVHFEEAQLDLLSVVASTLGVAIDNAALAEAREATIRELREAQAALLATQERLVRSEQLAVIGRLASGIAHEVKNHLSPFMLADMIRLRYPDDAEIQEAAEMMLEAQRHIYGLVDEIRIFARGSESAYDLAPHDLGQVVEAALRFLRCDAKVKRCRLELIREAEPLVEIDAHRIRQVLINLVRNAADAIGDGDGRIVVRISEAGEEARIDVEDDGPGVPPELAERIFEPLFSTKGDQGLGLGLDISRKIVRAHGGELSLRARPGGPTVFRVGLPFSPTLGA